MFVHCMDKAEHILKPFSTVCQPTILVFPNCHTKYYGEILTGFPLTGGSNAGALGYEKIAIFDHYLALSRKQYKIRPHLL